jgi:glycosyltransferase involved in cell wall biosynthesis
MTESTDPDKKVKDLGEEEFRLNEPLAEADKRISEFLKENVELRQQVAQLKIIQELLRESLLDAENNIEDLRGAAVQWRLDAAERKALHTRLENEAAEREVLRARLTDRDVALEEILSSTSWRVSAPIRMVGRWIRKLARVNREIRRPQCGAYKEEEWAITREAQFLDSGGPADAPVDLENSPSPIVSLTENPSVNSSIPNIVKSACVKLESVAHFSLRQSTGKRQIVVAADIPPMFDQQSGALRLHSMMRILCEAGWRLSFSSQASRADFEELAGSAVNSERYESRLREIGVENITYGSEEINAFLEAEGSDLRWALLSFPKVAHNLIPLIRIHAPWAGIIYDMVDFHYLRMTRLADLNSDEMLRSSALQMREMEIANARTSDLTFAISEAERQAMLKLDPSLVVKVVPNIFEVATDSDPELASRKDLLFVGGFAHVPNIDAVQWFVEQIWPLIRQQRPNLKFNIAGSAASQGVLRLAERPGVDVLGFVKDLTPHFRGSRVFVAPLRYGAGVKGKVGQSMAQGLPVVGTRIAAEGMNAINGKDLLVADGPAAFAAAVIRLLDDDPLWLQLRANGKELIRQTQSIETIRIKLGNILNG